MAATENRRRLEGIEIVEMVARPGALTMVRINGEFWRPATRDDLGLLFTVGHETAEVWIDISLTGSRYQVQREATSGKYRHRLWEDQSWIEGPPPV